MIRHQVLQVIGESNKPLSGREIEKGWYVKYKMHTISGPEIVKNKGKVKEEVKVQIGPDGKRKYTKKMSYGDI